MYVCQFVFKQCCVFFCQNFHLCVRLHQTVASPFTTPVLPCVSQIQKLLDAQSKVPESPRASPEEQQEQAIQTSVLSEPLKKTSVSIAVGTGAHNLHYSISLFCFTSFSSTSNQLNTFKNVHIGASLFWSAPDQSSIHEEQSECDPEANSTVSSKLCSETIHHSREELSPATPRHSTSSPQHKYDITCC